MSNIIVSNWKEVYKSLAVWLPILGTAIYQLLQNVVDTGLVPSNLEVPLVAVLGILGWGIKQPSMRKGAK